MTDQQIDLGYAGQILKAKREHMRRGGSILDPCPEELKVIPDAEKRWIGLFVAVSDIALR